MLYRIWHESLDHRWGGAWGGGGWGGRGGGSRGSRGSRGCLIYIKNVNFFVINLKDKK